MMAKLGSYKVIVLVDSGSTHNFVSERIARLLRMPVVPIEPFTVRVANGENMKCHGRFEGVIRAPSSTHSGLSPINEVDQSLLSRDEPLKKLKHNLEASINRMKQLADLKRRDVTFEVGDLVFLKLHPYRQQSTFRRAHQKLVARFFGPYPIVQKIGAVAYKLQLPDGSCIHPVFHVSLLKKFVGEHTAPTIKFPPVSKDGVILLEPQHILDTRWVKQGSTFVKESLVYLQRRQRGKTLNCGWTNSPTWTLRTRVHREGGGSVDEPRRSARLPKPNPKYQG
ncbi:hypothetical protein F0562_012771 [Nyssa sinensis]|uniref:Tf2-1-like SH3-like domain-containing protein n=1 Tax=Nyssa sinensis TaxID=561372 RepID=A0A5J4ZT46_9ASTE|nr:hypothetical protein F0562_012771 [Nyssa sinensis]